MNPDKPHESDEIMLRRGRRLNDWLDVLGSTLRQDVTPMISEAYTAALIQFPEEVIDEAFNRGVLEWRFFPSIPEILDFVRESSSWKRTFEERREQRSEQLANFYKALPPRPALKSALDALGEHPELLPRERRLALGIEEPAPVDVERRLAELQRQADMLLAREADSDGVH